MSRHRLPLSGNPIVQLAPAAFLVLLLIAAISMVSGGAMGTDDGIEGRQAAQSGMSTLLGQSDPKALPTAASAGEASVMSWGFNYNDALTPPYQLLSSSGPVQPAPSLGLYEQSLYMMGTVAVTVIFPESDGTTDTNTEDWSGTRITNCISEITAGLNWWDSQESRANLNFLVNSYGQQATSYEPITRPQTDESLWIAEIMNGLGYTSGSHLDQVAALNQYEMSQQSTDWGFTIFVVDSQNDLDGKFSDAFWYAYAYTGGPFLVMTYDNNGYGIANMDYVCVHETGHVFWATDEYNSTPEYSGYLNVLDSDGTACVMTSNALPWSVCPATRGQIGWRDTDSDNILDPMDTVPTTAYQASPAGYANYFVLTYAGEAWDMPLNNSNPQSFSTGIDVSINTIADVEYRIDGGSWTDCTASDGGFDGRTENFTFITPSLSAGTHLIETRAQNSAGNWQTAFTQHTVVIDTTNPTIAMNGIPDYVSLPTSVTGSASDSTPGKLNSIQVQIRNVSQSTCWNGSTWVSSDSWLTASGTASWSYGMPALTDGQTYEVRARALDEAGNQSSLASDSFKFDTTNPVLAVNDIPDFLASLSFVSGTASDASPGQVDRVEMQIRNVSQSAYWNGTAWASSETWLTATGTNSWNCVVPALTNGEAYEIQVRAFDKAGNQSSASAAFYFDTTSPAVSLNDMSDFVSSPSSVGGSASDSSPGQVGTVEVQIRNASESTCWNGTAWISGEVWLTATGTASWNCALPLLTDGQSYQVKARALDKAGNASTEVVEAFVNDATAPELSGISDIGSHTGSVPDVGGAASDAPPGSLDRIEILLYNRSKDTYWNGSSWVPEATWTEAAGTESWSYEIPRLRDGHKYELTIRALDLAGNESSLYNDDFTFDSRPPFWIWIIVGLASALIVTALVAVLIRRARTRRESLGSAP